jgi:hypothetical protein
MREYSSSHRTKFGFSTHMNTKNETMSGRENKPFGVFQALGFLFVTFGNNLNIFKT